MQANSKQDSSAKTFLELSATDYNPNGSYLELESLLDGSSLEGISGKEAAKNLVVDSFKPDLLHHIRRLALIEVTSTVHLFDLTGGCVWAQETPTCTGK